MHLRGREFAIAGGGVAGLAAARALALRGAKVTVIERATALAEVGAGLQISPNGARALIALGLGDALAAASIRARAVSLTDGLSGRGVLRLDLPGHPDHPGFHLLHRADLIDLLVRGAADAGVHLRLGTEVHSVELTDRGARLHLAGGEIIAPDLVIGADGVKSRMRAAMNGDAAPFFTGQVAWRALIPGDGRDAPLAEVFMGPGRHLVSYPLRGGTLRNIVAVEERSAWTEEGWALRDRPEAVRDAFGDFAEPVRGWLAALDEVFLWGLFRHPVAARWTASGAALLGDAAHPTVPFLAQGANMALEDAHVLAACLDRDWTTGLARYQALRKPRCIRIVAAADRSARAYHLHRPMSSVVHMALRLGGALSGRVALHRLRWLHEHDVTTDV